MARKSGLDMLWDTLLVVGGLNWGLIGLTGANLVDRLLGGTLAKIVYIGVGVAAAMALWRMVRK